MEIVAVSQGLWVTGQIKVGAATYQFEAKVYGQPSEYGINGGKISKLWISWLGKTAYLWDRGDEAKTLDLEWLPDLVDYLEKI